MKAQTHVLFLPGLLNDASLFQQQIDVLSAVASTDVADLTQAETIADAARSVLDLAPKEPFVLVGLSLGGYVAFEIMRQAPERVAALALLDTSARPESPEARAARTALMTLAETDLEAVFEQRMIMARPDSRPSLADIRCPTLVICGREDLITPLPIAAEIAAGIQDSRLCIVENCGHLSPLDQPDEVARLLLEWITHLHH